MSTVFLPGAYSQHVAGGGSSNPQVPDLVPALVGVTSGKTVRVVEAVTRGGSANTADTLTHTPVSNLVAASLTAGGTPNFTKNVDYTLSGNTITWAAATRLTAPLADSPAIYATSGGTFPSATTYYYKVTARLGSGETIGSNTVSIAVSATTQKVNVLWGTVPNAVDYRVFRSTNSDMSSSTLQSASAVTAPTTNYVDVGAAGTTTAVPGSNTTDNEPLVTTVYYVTYEYTDTSKAYAQPKRYTSLRDIFEDHGLGSQVSVMAEFAMSTQGRGNGCAAVWVSGCTNDTTSFQNGIAAYENVRGEVLLVVVGKKNTAVDLALRTHLTNMNAMEAKRERMAITWSTAAAAIGDSGTTGTVLYDAAQSSRRDIVHIVPDSGSALGLVQQTDGTYVEATLNAEYIAAGVAGLAAALPDAATPWTRKGFTGLTAMGGVEYSYHAMQNLRDGGVTVIDNVNGQWRILEGRTTLTSGESEFFYPSTSAADMVVSMVWRNVIDPEDTFVGASGSLIGQKITDGLLELVYTRTMFSLDFCLKRELIRDYTKTSIVVVQDQNDRTRINVAFEYTAIFPAHIIQANISFKPTA